LAASEPCRPNRDLQRASSIHAVLRSTVPPRGRGEGLKVQAVENVARTYGRWDGLEDVTPHTLRHTFGKGLVGLLSLLGRPPRRSLLPSPPT
jgi:integrase